MKVFLTGGTGFIGSHIAMELQQNGHEIWILARNPQKIPALKSLKGIQIVEGSLTDTGEFPNWLKGMDACIHVALNYRGDRGWKALEDDTLPSIALAAAASEAGLRQFIYTSSTSVNDSLYHPENRGEGEGDLVVDAETAHSPGSYYGATKAAVENYLMAMSWNSSMRINIIRPGYTFGNPALEGGPTQSDDRFFRLIDSIREKDKIEMDWGDGTQFIWADDLALLYRKVLESPFNRKIYFGLSKDFITWYAVARMIQAETKWECDIQRIAPEKDEGRGLLWDVSAMKEDFGLAFAPGEHLLEHIRYCLSPGL